MGAAQGPVCSLQVGTAGQHLVDVTILPVASRRGGTEKIASRAGCRPDSLSDLGSVLVLDVVGIVLAVLATLFVLVHARISGMSIGATFAWGLGTLLLSIIVLPAYLLIHVRRSEPNDDD